MKESRSDPRIQLRRETSRKRRLREVLESTDRGILLDELRWAVEGPHFASDLDEESRRSLMNSFARTVREQLTNYVICKIPINSDTPVGLVARAAAYRLKDADALRRFLGANNPCILCRYKKNFEVHEPRYQRASPYCVPQFHAATFRFFESRPARVTYSQLKTTAGSFIPATQKLTLIAAKETTPDLQLIAEVPWTLFACDSVDNWREVSGTEPLECCSA